MLPYPKVLTEDQTLDRALAGMCVARYGDGELNLALGGACIFQKPNNVLAAELKKILVRPRKNLLVCIPNIEAPTKASWKRYGEARYRGLYTDGPYGSAFISRPDSATWIDTPEYWAKLSLLWQGKHVTLVKGTDASIRPEQLDAASVRIIHGPGEDAFAEIDRIDREIGSPRGPVLLCLGPTATVLAHRLSLRKVQGLDLGHVGRYMRHRGAYAIKPADLASAHYRDQIRQLHARGGWGGHGASHADQVLAFAAELGAKTVLDYGCGQATLQKAVHPALKVQNYDPGVPKRAALPKPEDLVVATDVLEHIEPEALDAVLRHISLLAGKGAFLVISCQPARETLPDGRNAHLSVHDETWWWQRFQTAVSAGDWSFVKVVAFSKGIRVWLTK